MRIIGCDLHARQQTIAMLDSETGELEEKTLEHEADTVREFYSALRGEQRDVRTLLWPTTSCRSTNICRRRREKS